MITNSHDVLLGHPQIYVTDCDISEFCNFQWKLVRGSKKKIFAGMIRGQKCRTIQGLFDEFSAVLQFPYYFGENWDAFDECLNDLEWITADAFVLCICNTENLLHLSSDNFATFIKTLSSAVQEWENGRDFGAISTPPTPFNIVFHCGNGEQERVFSLFYDMGIELERV